MKKIEKEKSKSNEYLLFFIYLMFVIDNQYLFQINFITFLTTVFKFILTVVWVYLITIQVHFLLHVIDFFFKVRFLESYADVWNTNDHFFLR